MTQEVVLWLLVQIAGGWFIRRTDICDVLGAILLTILGFALIGQVLTVNVLNELYDLSESWWSWWKITSVIALNAITIWLFSLFFEKNGPNVV